MSLNSGTKIGPYEVTGLIGQGGMGEVYQARDTKLDRDVALKVLPEAFTSEPSHQWHATRLAASRPSRVPCHATPLCNRGGVAFRGGIPPGGGQRLLPGAVSE